MQHIIHNSTCKSTSLGFLSFSHSFAKKFVKSAADSRMPTAICRVCGSVEHLKYVAAGDAELLEKIRTCANIAIDHNDCLPKYICADCELGLEFAYRLRKRGEQTEKRLRLELDAAQESIEDDSNEQLVELIAEDETAVAEELLEQEVRNLIEEVEEEDEESYVPMDDELYEEYVEEEQPLGTDDDDTTCDNEMLEAQIEAEESTHSMVTAKSDKEDKPEQLNTMQVYICATCKAVLSTQMQYREHIKVHGDARFRCPVAECNKWFPTRARLQKHEQSHERQVEMHECPQCDRSYRMRCNLVRHIRSAHEQQRRYVCAVCAEAFGRSDVLKTHMLKHVEEKSFTCQQCGDSFKTQRYLGAHMRSHLPKHERNTKRSTAKDDGTAASNTREKRNFHCPYCGKISKHNFTHRNHLRTHTQERPFSCSVCDKSFRTMAAMQTHERIHRDLRPYQCEQCLISFRQASHLKEHYLMHAGITPHVCGICNMAFTKKSNMQTHLRVHSGVRPYKCASCPQQFTKTTLLKRHESTAHRRGEVEMANNVAETDLASEEVLAAEAESDNELDVAGNETELSYEGVGADRADETAIMLVVDDENVKFNSVYMVDE